MPAQSKLGSKAVGPTLRRGPYTKKVKTADEIQCKYCKRRKSDCVWHRDEGVQCKACVKVISQDPALVSMPKKDLSVDLVPGQPSHTQWMEKVQAAETDLSNGSVVGNAVKVTVVKTAGISKEVIQKIFWPIATYKEQNNGQKPPKKDIVQLLDDSSNELVSGASFKIRR